MKKIVKNIFNVILKLIFALFLFNSCMTMADYDFSTIDKNIEEANYSQATKTLETKKNIYYSNKENVLETFDFGLLQHFSLDFENSNKNFSEAEKQIDLNFTKSITQGMGQILINDTVANYTGEIYEDIYSNIFMCLNYIHLNNIDDAMVEIRRFDNKMKVAAIKYQQVLDYQKQQLKAQHNYYDFTNIDATVDFHNSAFARYLSMLLYRTQNDLSSAQIDYKKIQEAFAFQKHIYNFDFPTKLKDELVMPKNLARINTICFFGRGPIKKEEVVRINFRSSYYKLALPILQKSQNHVRYIQVVAYDINTNTEYKMNTYLIESIENIMQEVYKQHFAQIYTRTLFRSIAKAVKSAMYDVASKKSSSSEGALIFGLLNLFSQASTEITERADVRCCRYMPSYVSVGGMNVNPGIYNIKVNYYNKNKKIIHSYIIPNFKAEVGKLNLVESIYQGK